MKSVYEIKHYGVTKPDLIVCKNYPGLSGISLIRITNHMMLSESIYSDENTVAIFKIKYKTK